MKVPKLLAAVAALGLGAGCSIADPQRPGWLEVHGHPSADWIAATPGWVLGLGAGKTKLFKYPGGWDNPWEQYMVVDARQMAADQATIWTLNADGAVLRWSGPHGSPAPLTNGGGINRFAVSAAGEVHVLAQDHPQRLVDGRLVDTPCAARAARALAVGSAGTYLVTVEGKLALESKAGSCDDLAAPFQATDIAAVDLVGGHFTVAAVDNHNDAWLRRSDGGWEQLPRPISYRPGYRPRSKPVEQLALSAFALWARTVDGSVFLFTDPR
jgi:hypothetical protein